MRIPFVTQSYKSESLPVSAQRAINCYAEKEPPDAKTEVALFVDPGLTLFSQCGPGPIRGMHVMNGTLYVVSGTTLYSVSSTGTATALGGAVSGTGVVRMDDNGTQVMIVNGAMGYVWAATTGFQVVTDVNFHAANTITFFDNVFVFDWIGTNKFFICNTLDGTTYPGLGFASAEVQSDYVLSTVNQQETLLIFGQRTIETWYDAGLLNMPFQRVDGATIERGCAAALSPAKEDNSVFFLGDDVIFYRLNQITPVRTSTHAIEQSWQAYSNTLGQGIDDCFTFSYTWNGHKFIAVTFPQANSTWVFDIATGLWHEKQSWDRNNNNLGRWRGNCSAECYGYQLIGDAFSGNIGYLDDTAATEFGNTLQVQMVSPPIHNDRKRVFISRFELDVETGVGLNTGQGSDPQVMLEWSQDGGRTFSQPQAWVSAGQIGAYTQRLRWLRLGQARQWVFRVTISDPVRRVVLAASADLSMGM